MKYRLEAFVTKLTSPVIVIIDGTEREYAPGELAKAYFPKKYEIVSLSAKDNKIILELDEAKTTQPFNYVGEAVLK